MKNKSNKNETYKIQRNITASKGRPGRKPSTLGNTMRMLNIGDGFTYPYTSGAATFNVQRAARACGIEMCTKRVKDGIFAVRNA